MRHMWCSAAVAAVLLATAWALTGCENQQQEKPKSYTFTVAESYPTNHPSEQAVNYFASLLNQRSDGRMTVQVVASTLSDPDRLQAVKNGTHTMTTIYGPAAASDDARLTALALPYLFKTRAHFISAMSTASGKPGHTIISGFPGGKGIVPVALFDSGARNFFTSTAHPLTNSPGATWLNGLGIRMVNLSLDQAFPPLLGGVSKVAPFDTLYTSLQTAGDIKGAEQNLLAYHGGSFHQVAKNYYLDEHMRAPEVFFFNEAVFNQLTSTDQAIVRQAAADTATWQYAKFEEAAQAAKTAAVTGGATMTDVSDAEKNTLRNAVQSLYDNTSYNTSTALIAAIEALRP